MTTDQPPANKEVCVHYMRGKHYVSDPLLLKWPIRVMGCFDQKLLDIDKGIIQTTAAGWMKATETPDEED